MAAVGSLLVQCLSRSRLLNLKMTALCVCSVGINIAKGHQLMSQHILLSRLHTALFYSNMAPESSIGQMRRQAALGFKTGGDNYDAHRPSYTDESVDLIVSEIVATSEAALGSGLKYDVLELGAGTGKLTERLCKKLPSHLKYLATEPSENFLEVLKSKGLNVDVAIATADRIPLADNTVGTVVCAQSFHWFSSKDNLDSIHRVLTPGGKLILIWNMPEFSYEFMVAFYEQTIEVVKKTGGSVNYLINFMDWRKDIDVSEDFKLLWHRSLTGIKIQGDIEEILSNHATGSAYKLLPAAECDAYIDQLRQILKTWPGLNLNNITIPHTTELFMFTAQ
ncbi:unnamed protein product [Candidula unifasciata]|uniref:Methyltransferase domain-containing protein n=1 Tax=Candidula unifasciata TaxID=100452 RepID=A0A8S3YLK8_9EUPU|nr:unnamed protein product [Candidula unifasciata]